MSEEIKKKKKSYINECTSRVLRFYYPTITREYFKHRITKSTIIYFRNDQFQILFYSTRNGNLILLYA